jgi:hypothetical protein
MPEKGIVIFDVPGVGRSEMSWRPAKILGLARASLTNFSIALVTARSM